MIEQTSGGLIGFLSTYVPDETSAMTAEEELFFREFVDPAMKVQGPPKEEDVEAFRIFMESKPVT